MNTIGPSFAAVASGDTGPTDWDAEMFALDVRTRIFIPVRDKPKTVDALLKLRRVCDTLLVFARSGDLPERSYLLTVRDMLKSVNADINRINRTRKRKPAHKG